MSEKFIGGQFAELVRRYGAPSAECQLNGHREEDSVGATLHDQSAGASWIETFVCSSCGYRVRLVVCDKYHNALIGWLQSEKGMAGSHMGNCADCGAASVFGETYKGGVKWG